MDSFNLTLTPEYEEHRGFVEHHLPLMINKVNRLTVLLRNNNTPHEFTQTFHMSPQEQVLATAYGSYYESLGYVVDYNAAQPKQAEGKMDTMRAVKISWGKRAPGAPVES